MGGENSAALRLWDLIEKTDTCWIWHGPINHCANGDYGYFRFQKKGWYAHRYVYELLNGPVPEGLELDHKCRVTLCVNPNHLEPVDHRTNVLRGVSMAARLAAQTHCHRGHLFDEENTHWIGGGSRRECRACSRESKRAYKLRQRTAA